MSKMVPEGWKESTIGELTATNSLFDDGDWVESKDQDPYGSNRLIQLADIGDGVFVNKSSRFMNNEQFKRLKCTELEPNDILIARMPDPLGRACLYPDLTSRAATVVDVAILRTKNADHYWLMSAINSSAFRHQIDLNASGTTRTRIARGLLSQIQILTPSLPEQQKIATILLSVDDAIEKTRAQIDKLKDLKTGMMQELLTKGIGHTEFKDSPVGRIPAAWDVFRLGALASFVTSGSRGWAKYYSKSGAVFIRIGNLTREHINLRFDDTIYVNPPDSAEGKRTQVVVGDVLISITADLGIIGVVNEALREAYVNQHVSLVRLHQPEQARWVGHFLSFEGSQKQFVANNDAGAKAGLNLPAIRNMMIALPENEEREKIVFALDSIDHAIFKKRTKLQQDSALKKALMQDLLTGKVRVNVNNDKEVAVA